MLNHVIAFSLRNRALVLIAALAAAVWGARELAEMPVDVFPDLNRPTVTVMTEAAGLAPEEVEVLVTRPLEYLFNGATGVRRVRSASGIGLSIVWIEFDWGTDIFRDRQIVAEKLQLARSRLPPDAAPMMAPISSIMGEIMLLGLRAEQLPADPQQAAEQAMELRTLAEFDLRNRLLAVDGVSQVTVMGGLLKQYQILTSPARLAAQDITLEQLVAAAERANVLAGGGILIRPPQESLIRLQGQGLTPAEIGETPVLWRGDRAVRIKEVAEVRFGGPIPRGDGSVRVRTATGSEGGPAVILAIQKQPDADTLRLDARLGLVLDELEPTLPSGFRLERRIFRQAEFIRAAVDNVTEAVRDGALWVVVVLFVFMRNFRTSFCSLVAMPLSILLTVVCFRWFGVSINTMTLGGIAVAIGDLVDDSIVDIENIARRLKENRHRAIPEPPLQVIYDASCEVRNSIVYATSIVILVVLPLFAMGGLEGRIFAPLGLAYVISLLASLAVSLTVTPVLGSFLLPRAKFLDDEGDPWVLRRLKSLLSGVLRRTLRHADAVLAVVAVGVTLSLGTLYWMGGEFLPTFNEGTVTVGLRTVPGTGLDESRRVAARAETLLQEVPEVLAISRRTGRAELDEHAEGVNSSELDLRLAEHRTPKPGLVYGLLRLVPFVHLWTFETAGRPREAVLADIRDRLASLPGIEANVGQPISHRLDHLLSGVRAQIAVKVFGNDLQELRHAAEDVRTALAGVRGTVDLQIEPQTEVPQLRVQVKRDAAARYGLAPGDVTRLLTVAFRGRAVSQILEDDRFFDLVVWYDETARNDPDAIRATLIDTPSGRRVPLGEVAEVIETTGPNTLNREHVERRIVVFCNVQGRDLAGVVGDIRRALVPLESRLRALPGHYRLELGGQFEAQQEAGLRLLVLGSLAVIGVFVLLCNCLGSWQAALQVLANVPLAAMGAILTLLIVNRPSVQAWQAASWWELPGVWIGATSLSLAHWVGFVTLIGVVARNGIMMISHYLHLMEHEGEVFGEEMIVRGSLERLAPVLMTACTSFIGLLPLLFGAGEPGKEILHPLALVVFGGMLASTLLDQLVTPALFFRFGSGMSPVSAALPPIASPAAPPPTEPSAEALRSD